MNGLKTSPNEIMRWLGVAAIRNSNNLKLPDPRKARLARMLWGNGALKAPALWPWTDGGDDAT